MTVKTEAFVSLYDSLDRKFSGLWEPMALEVSNAINDLLKAGKFDEAEAYANSLNLSSIADKLKPYMRFHTYSALYYGASRINGSAKESSIKYYSDPQVISRVVNSLHAAVAINVTKQVKLKLHDIIQKKRDGEVQKAESILRDFVSFDKEGSKMLQLISQLHTSRVSAYGYTIEAEMLGVTEYALSEQLDIKICPICAEAHGKTFKVEDARRALDTILYLEDPDDIKAAQPWAKQSKAGVEYFKSLTNDELVARNWHIPPFHPNCRGILVAKDQVPKLEDTPSYRAAMGLADKSFTLNPMAANRMNMGMTGEKLNYWNEKVGYDPRKILVGLSGLAGVAMAEALAAKNVKVGLSGNRVVAGVEGNIAGTGAVGKLYFEFNPLNRVLTITDVSAETMEAAILGLKGVLPLMIDLGVFEVNLPSEIAAFLNLSSNISLATLISALK